MKVALDNHDRNYKDRVEICSLWVHEKSKESADIYGVTIGFNACLTKITN